MTRAEIEQELKQCIQQEQSLDLLIQQSLPTQEKLDSFIHTLASLKPSLMELTTQALALSNSISRTSKLSDQMSVKVRQLDAEQSRLQSILQLLDAILEIKSLAVHAQKSLSLKNYDQVAAYIEKYLTHDDSMIQKVFRENYNPSDGCMLEDGSNPIIILESIQKEMTALVSEEFDNAVSIMDRELMMKYLKLFPPLGQSKMGIEKFSGYLTSLISKTCQDGMVLATSSSANSHIYVDIMTKLFETVALIIHQQNALVENLFGNGQMRVIISNMIKETDKQACIFIDSFSDHKNLPKKIHDIKIMSRSRRNPAETDAAAQLDLSELDSILLSIASICQKISLFEKFVHSYFHTDEPALDRNEPDFVWSDEFKKNLKMLVSSFITCQDFYIQESISKALSIDAIETGSLTSSSVDDVFFILKASAHRALTTSDGNCYLSTLSSLGLCLNQQFLNNLTDKLAHSSGSIESKEGRLSFMILLNNLDVSCEYIGKLVKDLQADVARNPLPEFTSKIQSCFTSLLEESASFRNALKSWIENLFNRVLKSRMKPILMQAYGGDIKYVLNDEEFAEQQSSLLFVNRFITSFKKLTSYYKNLLTDSNYNQLLLFLLDQMFKDWEKHLMNMKFNLLGATRLDEDIRAVTANLATLTDWSFRDKFTRLNQISTLLNLDDVQEVYEYWGSRTWRLKSSEVRAVLTLRVDFSVEDINKLKLK